MASIVGKFSVEPFSKGSWGLGATPRVAVRRQRNPPIVQKRPKESELLADSASKREKTTSGVFFLFGRLNPFSNMRQDVGRGDAGEMRLCYFSFKKEK